MFRTYPSFEFHAMGFLPDQDCGIFHGVSTAPPTEGILPPRRSICPLRSVATPIYESEDLHDRLGHLFYSACRIC